MLTMLFSRNIFFSILFHSIYALEATITSMTYSGSGCPVGSVSTSKSLDSTVLTQGFDAFMLYIGPGTRPSDRSKNCIVDISFDVRAGDNACGKVVVNRRGLDLSGFANIDVNDTVSVRVGYDWQGVSGVVSGDPSNRVM